MIYSFKASLCLGNTSDSENNKEDSSLIDTRLAIIYLKYDGVLVS